MADAYCRRGDCVPPLTGTLLNVDRSSVDLTGCSVALEMVRMSTGSVTTLPATTVDDPTLGLVQHEWQAGETAIAGSYFYRWLVTWPSATRPAESFPNHGRGLVLSITP